MSTQGGAPKRRDRRLRIVGPTGQVVCSHCEIADRPWARMRGLLGRTSLESGGGLLIKPTPSVHMFFMRFAIDVVFLDRENRVVGIAHTLKPWRIAGARRAHAALELPAGTAETLALQKGDVLQTAPAEPGS
jgi:uncharacterized protein